MPKTDFTPPSDDKLLTLAQIQTAVGAPGEHVLASLVSEDSRENYVRMGNQVRTGRVVTDARRIYAIAYAFWTQASPAQRDDLVGFSEPLLATCVAHAIKLAALDEASTRKTAAHDAQKAAHETAMDEATQRAVARRDQIKKVLLRVAAGDTALTAKITGKDLGADTPEHLAGTLRGLAVVGREILKAHTSKTDPVAVRIKVQRLDEKHLAALESSATAVANAAGGQVAGGNHPVDQGELDYNDGVQLHLLEHVLSAFEKAHDLDPSIPRLVPISTRRLLGSHAKRAQTPSAQPAQPGPAQ